MKTYTWSRVKSLSLKVLRGISFEEVAVMMDSGAVVAVLDHPNQNRYAGQKIWLVRILDYIYMVPGVEGEKSIRLITIIPSRKYTRMFIKKRSPSS